MTGQGAYGEQIGEHFRPQPPPLAAETLPEAPVAVRRLRCDPPDDGMTTPMPRQDAFLVGLHLREELSLEMWIGGRPLPTVKFPKTVIGMVHLGLASAADRRCSFDTLLFYLPRVPLDQTGDDEGDQRRDSLPCPPPMSIHDDVVSRLASLLVPALKRPDQANKLFVNHVALALCTHLVHTYGGMPVSRRPGRGGLAPWQLRRAKEILSRHIEGEISLAEVARECGLSRSHFARAFKQCTGVSPHRWLLGRRVELAKDLLVKSNASLAEIALACGFADQSHFTRVFSGEVGTSPGAWRRMRKS
jgi:AraC family transcriptional regulator